MMVDQTVAGLDQLAKMLKQLPANISRNVLRQAVSAGAQVIVKEARLKAPEYSGPEFSEKKRETHPPPGTLKRSIYKKQIRELSDLGRQVFFVGARHGKKSKFDAYYFRFVEFGTSRMPARPFMRPAFEAKKMEAVEAMRQYMLIRIPVEVEKLK